MKRLISIVFFLSLIFMVSNRPAFAEEEIAYSSARLIRFYGVKIIQPDLREEKLNVFLAQHKSVLLPYTKTVIQVADQYQLPWNLVVAISGVESTFCKRIPKNSYNCWGWNNGNYYFNDYEHAITHVSKIIKTKYFDRGLTTPEKMSRVYAPPSKTWGGNVRFFMNKIEQVNLREANLAGQFTI